LSNRQGLFFSSKRILQRVRFISHSAMPNISQ